MYEVTVFVVLHKRTAVYFCYLPLFRRCVVLWAWLDRVYAARKRFVADSVRALVPFAEIHVSATIIWAIKLNANWNTANACACLEMRMHTHTAVYIQCHTY